MQAVRESVMAPRWYRRGLVQVRRAAPIEPPMPGDETAAQSRAIDALPGRT